MSKKKSGEIKEPEKPVEDIVMSIEKALAKSGELETQMADLGEKIKGFDEKYERFFNQMPAMIELVRKKLEKYRSPETIAEITDSVYEVPFWEGYLSALLWVKEIVKGLDTEVFDKTVGIGGSGGPVV